MRIIAFDLDNTFLDKNKQITPQNLDAIKHAMALGVEIVPSTGRLMCAIPETLKKMCRYFITTNGARVIDTLNDEIIYESTIPCDLALEIYDHGDTLPIIYDAYIGAKAYMSESMHKVFHEYAADKVYAPDMIKLRNPVPDLKSFVGDNHFDVHKIQYFFKDNELRRKEALKLQEMFPDVKITDSLGMNVEANYKTAGKGMGLEALCAHIGCTLDDTVAFGDGKNDIELLQYAGISYCMIDGNEEVKPYADRITQFGCNDSGVATEIEKLLNS